MKINRRKFFGFSAAAGATGLALGKLDMLARTAGAGSSKNTAESTAEASNGSPLLARGLVEGSKVAITAPASHTSMGEVGRGIRFFKSMGCSVVVGETLANRKLNEKYLSASDEVRAAEFMEFIKNPEIDMILTARGGYGSLRILDYLDYEAIRQNPKIIIGFSDITALINAIHSKTGLVTFHGPVASSEYTPVQKESLRQVFFANENFKPIVYKHSQADVVNEGKATGRLIGGNLSMLVSLLGTAYEIDTRGAILFIEETREEPYKIDRMLTQLLLCGKLQAAAAVVFGYFKNMDARKNFYPGMSFTVRQVIASRVATLTGPVMTGLPIGHHDNNITLPLGVTAGIDTSRKTLTILEPPLRALI